MQNHLDNVKLISQKISILAMQYNSFIYNYILLDSELILALYVHLAGSTEMSQMGEHDIRHRVRRAEPSHLH